MLESLFIKLQAFRAIDKNFKTYITQRLAKNTFCYKTPPVAASVNQENEKEQLDLCLEQSFNRKK